MRSKSYFVFLFSLSVLFLILLLYAFSPSANPLRDLIPDPLRDPLRFFVPPKTLNRFHLVKLECGPRELAHERFLWYAPHSGFSNQLSELKNAILFATILNRTLIIPPVLDHHAVALGSCPKFRVTSPSDLRAAVWDHIMDLIRDRRYISMADIIDLSSVSYRDVKMIDFRIFVSTWCGFNADKICVGNSMCANSSFKSSSTNSHHCRSLLSGLFCNANQCVHGVEEDCRTTVWTYRNGDDGAFDSFQPDKQLLKRKNFSYVRKRRDLHKTFGPGSDAEMAKILAFGSLFSSPYRDSELYIDIHKAPGDSRIQSIINDLHFLPFAPEIITAGIEIAREKIKEPFLCTQLRLLDGQFKYHWKATFSQLKEKLRALRLEQEGKKDGRLIHIFIMTDLPKRNWTGTYLEELEKDEKSNKLYTLHENDESIVKAAKSLVAAKRSLKYSSFSRSIISRTDDRVCTPVTLPDILLYVEEIVCSCASMGFVGTVGSMIAEGIRSMRENDACRSSYI